MELGAFSVSLTVKDLAVSEAFYEKFGFKKAGGDAKHGYMILTNGTTVIGLSQGMFDKNILTFNPGLRQDTHQLDSFTDIRLLQKRLKEEGVELLTEVDESSAGPGSITCVDPDGNPILIDQFF
ncbi:MAG: lactoylglutathione lyase [Rhodothermales bacterium]|jgi:lactoylglutathione lyase